MKAGTLGKYILGFLIQSLVGSVFFFFFSFSSVVVVVVFIIII